MTLVRSGTFIARLTVFLALAIVAAPSAAIILHNDDEPSGTEIPGSAFVGTYRTNSSCVVIAPNFIITTTHQGAGTDIVIDGVTYTAAQTWNHDTADIRVVRIVDASSEPANLGSFAELWTTDQGIESGNDLVIGGFGRSRGATLTTGGKPYGYAWGPETSVDQLRWGTNISDSTGTKVSGTRTSSVILADFDGLQDQQGDPTTYEAGVAEFDSGGGWFILQDSTWYVAGITRGAEHAALEQTWYRQQFNPNLLHPDEIDAVRIRTYANWIYSIIRVDGDTNGDLLVDLVDLGRLATNYGVDSGATWYDGDFTDDGAVDLADLGKLAANYGFDGTGGMPGPPGGAGEGDTDVPEPTVALLLALAGPVLLARRRVRS